MTTLLNDTRSVDAMTVEEADGLFADIASLEISIRKRLSQAEKRIADIKAAAEADVADDKAALKLLADKLALYVVTHKERFAKPRKRKTNWGSYGLRTATKLEILSEEEVIRISDDLGLDLYKLSTSIDKKQVEKAIADGHDLASAARIVTGDIASYDIEKSLLAK